MKYLAKDGKVFDNECKCMEYEHSLDEAERKHGEEKIKLETSAEQVEKALENFAEQYAKVYSKSNCSNMDLYNGYRRTIL